MKARLLGSGVATGVPTWNDGSEIARKARTRDPDHPRRAGACLAVSADGVRFSILEAPFHLAASLANEPLFAPPEGSRAVPIDSLVLTSGDLDGSAGALALRSGLAIRIASPADLRRELLDHDAAFVTLEPLWTGLGWDRPFPLDRDEILEARLFPLPGPIPDHLRDRSTSVGRARCGVRITDRRSGRRLVWAPRIERLDTATLAELREADVRFVDGTCYAAEEARRLRPGARTPDELGHVPIDGAGGSLAVLAGMNGRSIYVHVAASNPLAGLGAKEAKRVSEAGVEVGLDGLEVEI
ncbi:MAG: MBL fold metallo-hydrolase [bacterium]|nr:MBL fold metallo-hydrolase [bacterium]